MHRLIAILFLLLIPAPCLGDEKGHATHEQTEAFLTAARKGDLGTITSLLEKGIDPDVRSEYGATALSFAADKGYTAIVALLLESGASTDIVDTFYGASPLLWATTNKHADVLELLVTHGANFNDRVLGVAIEKGHAGLLRAILDSEALGKDALSRALKTARSQGKSEIARLLEEAGVEAPDTAAVTAELLALYAGTYKNDQIGMEMTFRPEGEALKGVATDQPELTYEPRTTTRFASVEVAGIEFEFEVKDGKVPGVTLYQGGATLPFLRVETAATPDVAAPEAPPTEPSVPVEKAAPWPSFRGSFASGNADGQRPPLSWDVPAGRNVRFKTTVPGLGHSCPVVWGDRVYLTTAVGGEEPRFRHGQYGDVDSLREDTPHRWMALAYDRASGALVWERELHRGVPLVRRHLKGTHANCTPATDGKHLVVNLGSEGLYCLDPEGKTLWKVDLGVLDSGWFYDPEYQWGFGSSPVLHDGKVVIQVDIQEGSFIAAFDVDTGKELWRTLRDEIPSWGTPTVVVSEGRIQVVTNSSSAVRGYDLSTGRELWWLKGNSEVTVGTPVAGHGLIFFTGGYTPVQPIYAVRVGAQGDVTLPGGQSSSDAVAWSEQRGGTYMPTPIVYGDHLYTLANQGVLTCYDARTGKRLYRERIAEGKGGGYTASPVAADGRLYFTAEDGIVYVVEAGPEYRLLASNPIGEVCMATPAISDGMIYVRSLGHLLGLGREAGSPSTPGR